MPLRHICGLSAVGLALALLAQVPGPCAVFACIHMDKISAGIITTTTAHMAGPPFQDRTAFDTFDTNVRGLTASAVQMVGALDRAVLPFCATGACNVNFAIAARQGAKALFEPAVGRFPVQPRDVAIAFADGSDKGVAGFADLGGFSGRIMLAAGHQQGRREEEYKFHGESVDPSIAVSLADSEN